MAADLPVDLPRPDPAKDGPHKKGGKGLFGLSTKELLLAGGGLVVAYYLYTKLTGGSTSTTTPLTLPATTSGYSVSAGVASPSTGSSSSSATLSALTAALTAALNSAGSGSTSAQPGGSTGTGKSAPGTTTTGNGNGQTQPNPPAAKPSRYAPYAAAVAGTTAGGVAELSPAASQQAKLALVSSGLPVAFGLKNGTAQSAGAIVAATKRGIVQGFTKSNTPILSRNASLKAAQQLLASSAPVVVPGKTAAQTAHLKKLAREGKLTAKDL